MRPFFTRRANGWLIPRKIRMSFSADGELSVLNGALSMFYGALRASNRALSVSNGTLSVSHERLSAYNGALSASHGALRALNGALRISYGALRASNEALRASNGRLSVLNGALSVSQRELRAPNSRSIKLSALSLFSDTPQCFVRADEQLAIRRGQRGIGRFAYGIGGEQFKLGRSAQHKDVSGLVWHVKLAASQDHR
jgi:hypothetical protein